jgi:type 1 glutamine amidotransferase
VAEGIKALFIGGQQEKYHPFAVMAPIFEEFLTAAGFEVTATEDRDALLPDRLEPYDVVVCNTTGGDLNAEQASGLVGSVKRGLGFVGVHSATDSFVNTPGYLNMVGGRFLAHPSKDWSTDPPTCPVHRFRVRDPNHPIMEGIDDFEMREELYLMETYGPFHLLLSTEFQDFERPVAWTKPYGFGRVFYTALGHGAEQVRHPVFQRMVANGVAWAKNPYR